jgi:hypothetical protein
MVYLQDYSVSTWNTVWYTPEYCAMWGLNGYFPCIYIPCPGFAYHMQADINRQDEQ